MSLGQNLKISQEMIEQAEKDESELLSQHVPALQAQNQYLNNRVVLLRAVLTEQDRVIVELREKLGLGESEPAPQS